MSDDWSSCSVVSNEYEAEGLRLVKIQVPEELSAGYKAPGQYVKIKVGDNKPGFYAIASPPGLPNETTFLVKETLITASLPVQSLEQH